MTGGINVQYFRQEGDVALYGRKCSKYLRNNVRESSGNYRARNESSTNSSRYSKTVMTSLVAIFKAGNF